jgi:hypothetical protein
MRYSHSTIYRCIAGLVQANAELAGLKPKRVAERDQFMGLLGGHRAGDDSRLKDGTFCRLDIITDDGLTDGISEKNAGTGVGRALRNRFVTDVHHGWLIVFIDMGKHSNNQLFTDTYSRFFRACGCVVNDRARHLRRYRIAVRSKRLCCRIQK